MRLYTPDGLLYPITVTKLLRQPGEAIVENAPLFTYEYKSQVKEWDCALREDVDVIRSFYANFESELEGTLATLEVSKGQLLERKALVAEIDEPCKHEIQFGGICAECGKDMTTVQYNSTVKNTARATVNTVHGHTQLLVSEAAASRADEEVKRRLLDSRKLSLVVDLDQTIIHATVDPTVAEWQRDPSNPNYDAVKDVRAFQLVDDGPGARGCWYYIKLRPGLQTFLDTISKSYELHIYTMGTRAYASNVAKIIDPDRKLFGNRILSRDESGSMTAKSLKRLFPVDTKMVVIIDDRGDVWHWSPNLIRVSAYGFFVGIGDINSSFLPKRPELESRPAKSNTDKGHVESIEGAASTKAADSTNASASESTAPTSTPAPATANGDVSAVDRMVYMAGKQDEGSIKEKATEQEEEIATQLADRPLLQKQKILDAAEEEVKASSAVDGVPELLSKDGEKSDCETESTHSRYRHNLLQDDDTELEHLGRNLRHIHQTYYGEHERELSGSRGGRVAELRPGHHKKRSVDELERIPDVAILMNGLKHRVLAGVIIVFSGVVPLGVNIHTHDTAIWARSFGATIEPIVTRRTTHVIAAPERRTLKVRQAAKRGRISIVSLGWLFACFSQWKRVDESLYRIHSDAPTSGSANVLPDSFDTRDNEILSLSDDDTSTTEGEGETLEAQRLHDGLSINTEVDVDELERLSPVGESPTMENAQDWEGINDELAEFLRSDDGDDVSDTESTKSNESTPSETPASARKRKRDAHETGIDTEADASTEAGGTSRLQRRKKKAMERSTSLTQVAPASSEDDLEAALEAALEET